MNSITKILEEEKRTLEKIKTFSRPAEELRRQLEQLRLSFEIPESVRRSIAEIQSGSRVSDELKLAAERIRFAEPRPLLPTLKEAFELEIPAELKRNLDQVRSFSRIPDDLARGLEEIKKSVQIPPGLLSGIDEMRATLEIPENLKRALESMTAITPPSEYLRRLAETITANIVGHTDLRGLWDAIGRNDRFTTLAESIAAAAAHQDEIQEVRVQNDGSIVLDGETITSTEIKSALTQFITERQQDVGSWVSTLREPLKKAMLFLLQTFLGAVLQIYSYTVSGQQCPAGIEPVAARRSSRWRPDPP